MSALLDLREEFPVRLVVSSKPDAYGLTRARRLGVATHVLPKIIDWDAVVEVLRDHGITHIFLTGFMKVVPSAFLEKWNGPILNVHPSLLPSYPGLKSIERARADAAAIGVTVHRVTADVDAGEAVFRKTVFRAGECGALATENVEFHVHLAEYELVRKSMKAASCWT